MMTEEDLLAANHESLHAGAALILGLRVDGVTIERYADAEDRLGRTSLGFHPDDKRSLADRAAASAQVALAAVLVAPGRGSQSDGDVAAAYGCAEIAGERGADVETWVQRQSDAAQRLVRGTLFRMLTDELSFELLARRALGPDDIERIVRATPGATTARIAALE